MNVTLNANRFQSYNNQSNPYSQNNYKQKVAFSGKPTDTIGREMEKAARGSKLFAPFNKAYNNATDWLAKNLFAKIVNNKTVQKTADKIKDSNYLLNHFLAVGSLITSGLYVKKTLDNKQLDKDRRNTLAINQLLTFVVSTVGAYSLDKSLNKWWNNVTAKYVGIQLDDTEFAKEYKKAVDDVKTANISIKEANKGLSKDAKRPLELTPRVSEFLKKHKLYNAEKHELLSKKVTGMGLLKTMIVFGMVYRFLVPVLVTPIANKLGDKMVQKRKEKESAQMNK